MYMYLDTNHLTNVYEATLTDIIYERALAAGWNPKEPPTSKQSVWLARICVNVKPPSAACGRGFATPVDFEVTRESGWETDASFGFARRMVAAPAYGVA